MAKIGWGCLASVGAFTLLSVLAKIVQGGGQVSWTWLLVFHLFLGLGYLYVWPVGMALFARAAPTGVRSMFIGIYYLALFVANNLAGLIGHFYERLSPLEFWLMQAAFAAGGALLVLMFGPTLSRVLAPKAPSSSP